MRRKLLVRLSGLLVLVSLISACGGPAQAPNAAATPPADATAAASTDSTAASTTPAATTAAAPESTAASTTPAAAAVPTDAVQVYAYINTGALNRLPEGSKPDRLAEINAVVAEASGVEIVPILPPGGQAATEKLNLLLSSPNERLDMFQGDWTQYAEAALPLNDLLQQHGQNILKAWPQESWDKMTDESGNIMGIPRLTPVAPYPVWVRTDLLEQLNMNMPKTVDELEAFLQAYKESDPNAIPLLGELGGLRAALLGAFTEYGNSNWFDSADNKLKPPELQPGFKDWVAKMADWYAKGYINRDTLGTTDGNKLRDVVKGQKVGAAATWYSIVTLSTPALNEANPDIAYDFTNITGPQGKAPTLVPPSTIGVVITKRAPNPEAIIKFINWQYASLENNLTAVYGIQGKDWEFVGEAEGTQELKPGTKLVKTGDAQVTGYAGEVAWSWGLPMETQYVTVNEQGNVTQHYQYINCCITELSVGKMPVDGNVVYNQQEIEQIFPNQQDWGRYIEENLTNFITGARPMSEWDAFIDGAQGVGLDRWIEAYTAQYLKRMQQ